MDSPEVVLVTLLASSALAFILFRSTSHRSSKPPPGSTLPPHVWSFLPYVGSAIDMGAGINEFIRKQSRKLNDTPFFSATILGDKCVFFADPKYLHSVVFKASHQKFLDTESLQKDFTNNVLSTTPSELDETFRPEVMAIGKSSVHQYLFQRAELNNNMSKVQAFFIDLVPTLCDEEGWTQHELFQMVVSAIFKASVGPLLSGAVANDEALQAFRAFDQGVIMMFNDLPGIFTRRAKQARDTLLRQLKSEEYWTKASELMNTRRKTLPVSPGALDKSNLGVLWASVGNSAPAVFWTLLRLMEDETAWKACQSQVLEMTASRQSDSYTLEDLDKLTLLESAFWESLRVYQANFMARKVKQGFTVETDSGKYYLEQGTKLMPFWGILHTDGSVFEDPYKWQYDRFVDQAKTYTYKDGTKLPYFPVVAFGGGSHLCPGRKFISYEARLFLAMLMESFDMRLVEGETRPGINPAMQGIGVSQPIRDPTVEIRRRVE